MSHIPAPDGSLTDALARLTETAGSLSGLAAELSGGSLNLRRLLDEVLHCASAIRAEVDEAALALRILESGQPLASCFPDGRPAPPVPSPRQVMYLANLASPASPVHARTDQPGGEVAQA